MSGFKKKVLVDYDEYTNLKSSKKSDGYDKKEKDENVLENIKRERKKLLSNKSIDDREKVLIDSYLMSNALRDEFSKSSKKYSKEDFEEIEDGGLGQLKRDRRRLFDSKSIDDRTKVMIDSYLMNNAHRIRNENRLKKDNLDVLIKQLRNEKTKSSLGKLNPIPRRLTSTPMMSNNDDVEIDDDVDLPSIPITNNSLLNDPDEEMGGIPQEFFNRYLSPHPISLDTSYESVQDKNDDKITHKNDQQEYFSYQLPQMDDDDGKSAPNLLISKRKLDEQMLSDLAMRKKLLLNDELEEKSLDNLDEKKIKKSQTNNDHKRKQIEKMRNYLKHPLKINSMRDLVKYTLIGKDIPSTSSALENVEELQPVQQEKEEEEIHLRKNPQTLRKYEKLLDLTERKRKGRPVLWQMKKLRDDDDDDSRLNKKYREKLNLKDHKVREKLRLREESDRVKIRNADEIQQKEKLLKELNVNVPQIIGSQWIDRGTLRRKKERNFDLTPQISKRIKSARLKGSKKKMKRINRKRN